MFKNYLKYFFLLNTIICVSQTYIVVDSITKKGIPYVSIKAQDGFVTNSNENGFFDSEKKIIDLSCLGYKILNIDLNIVKDSIFLSQSFIDIERVIVKSRKKKPVELYSIKRQPFAFHLNSQYQIGTLIKPASEIIDSYLESIVLPITKKSFTHTDSSKKFKSILKLDIYSNSNNYPENSLLDEPINIFITEDSNDNLNIDLSVFGIQFPREGIFICLEIIGEVNKENLVINSVNPRPSLVFSKAKSSNFSSQLYIRQKFKNKWEILKKEMFKLDDDFYLAIGLNISK